MAFKLKWECEYCGYEIVATREEAELTVCVCEIPQVPRPEMMSKGEAKLRYQKQYKLNGYSWLGKPPKMYQGEL